METINSLLENLKQKATNPFLGTIIFVAIVRYWDVVYAFFAFDDDCDMLYKQTYIHNYFAVLNFWKEILIIIVEAFAIIIATYLLLTASKFIMDVYQKHLLSRAAKIVDKNSVKTLEEYQSLERTLAESIEQISKANKENAELEMRVGRFKSDISERDLKISELNIQIGDLSQKNDNLIIDKTSLEDTSRNQSITITDLNHKINLFESHVKDLELDNEIFNKISSQNENYTIKISELEDEINTLLEHNNKLLESSTNIHESNNVENTNEPNYTIYNDSRVKIGNWMSYDLMPEWLKDSDNIEKIILYANDFTKDNVFRTLPRISRGGIEMIIKNNLIYDFLSLLEAIEKFPDVYVDLQYLISYIKLGLIGTKFNPNNNEYQLSDLIPSQGSKMFADYIYSRYVIL